MKGDDIMLIRQFNEDHKMKIPGNHPGLYGILIQVNRALVPQDKQEELANHWGGMPILLDADLQVEIMYLDQHASMEEHSAEQPILFLVINGQGYTRIGGPQGETREIQTGEAVLWPAYTDHTVWTEDATLQAIVITGPHINQ
jgi:quercetin dioxygenase-like cupin family protein